MARPVPVVRSMDSVAWSAVGRSRGAAIQVLLGPPDGVPNFVLRRFAIEPGGVIPAHRHPDIEHEQVVLEGEMVLTLDGKAVTVRAGDCVLIPAGVVHRYENPGAVPVQFLCIVPRIDDYRTEWMEAPAGPPEGSDGR